MWIFGVTVVITFTGIYLFRSDIVTASIHCMGGSSSQTMAAPVIIKATANHTATVIFLHGLGDTGHGWSDALKNIAQPHVKYVCPTANPMPVTMNGGFSMPSWFDIKGLGEGAPEDEAGIKSASKLLQSLISAEEKEVRRDRIVVGGFSQGGAVALYSALAEPQSPLAGVLALSTWLPLHKSFPEAAKSNRQTHMFQGHGEADPMVALHLGRQTGQLITLLNSKHKFKSYAGMGHSSSEEEMADVKMFLDETLPPI